MSKVDWSKAPDWATGHGRCGYRNFWISEKQYASVTRPDKITRCTGLFKSASFTNIVNRAADRQWPSESRIDIIGTNGNTAEHYMEETLHQTARVHYETQAELAARLKVELEAKQKTIKTASDFLSEGLRILSERGKQYDPSGTKEMSFDNVAEAFNCLTNSRLKGSDVCLILALLKVVRQNANKDFHEDSAVDFVNYAALYSEILKGEKA